MTTKGEVDGGMGKIGSEDSRAHTCDEIWVLYGSAESLNCTETNIALYVNCTRIKKN